MSQSVKDRVNNVLVLCNNLRKNVEEVLLSPKKSFYEQDKRIRNT